MRRRGCRRSRTTTANKKRTTQWETKAARRIRKRAKNRRRANRDSPRKGSRIRTGRSELGSNCETTSLALSVRSPAGARNPNHTSRAVAVRYGAARCVSNEMQASLVGQSGGDAEIEFALPSRLSPCASLICNFRPRHCGPLSRNLSHATAPTILPSNSASNWCCVDSTSAVSNCITSKKPRPATFCP